LRALVPVRPTVASFEVPATREGAPDLRTRFGVVPPSALNALRSGERALSDPVLLRAPADGSAIPDDVDGALALMLGGTVLRAAGRLGVYWESYGFDARDSVAVEVRIQPLVDVGTMQRLGIALKLSDDPRRSVSARWQEPQSGRTARSLDLRVPVQVRSVVLDVSRLQPGSYELRVLVGRRASEWVHASRVFRIED
jgi:hypothetical protein